MLLICHVLHKYSRNISLKAKSILKCTRDLIQLPVFILKKQYIHDLIESIFCLGSNCRQDKKFMYAGSVSRKISWKPPILTVEMGDVMSGKSVHS